MQARYFPIEARPLRMVASLARFGTDFGQGPLDRAYFQVDARHAEYVAQKAAAPGHRRFVIEDDERAREGNEEAWSWMRATLTREHPSLAAGLPDAGSLAERFDAIACRIQEDFAVLNAGEDDLGRTLAVDVRFPSGWHPERLRDAGFAAIHGPVPGFPPSETATRGMVRAMVDRGPYVRFVWTVGADERLDQHPELGDRVVKWERTERAFLRVERQVTVPLPQTRSSVFLIRTHVRPLSDLSESERATLAAALRLMPPEVRAYKSLPPFETLARFLA